MNETTIRTESATTVYIDHTEASYGIFCFNQTGDLFLNADWGFYGFSWRAYQGDFKDFLKKCDADYITKKLGMNFNTNASRDNRFGGKREKNVRLLVEVFLTELRNSL